MSLWKLKALAAGLRAMHGEDPTRAPSDDEFDAAVRAARGL